jgi:tetratricopeptide (TPR) repeat protein
MSRLTILPLIVLSGVAFADHDKEAPARPATLLAGLGSHRHSVSTANAEAQKFFDQGLTLLFAFNHDEAARSFARAAELDPNLAMAYWGLAVVKGPNYNLDADDTQWKAAFAALQKALELAARAPEPERDYIRALAKRYGPDPKADRAPLAAAYNEAMGELARKYPDDLDAATLYAESAMNLRPWKLWTPDGKPAPGTEEILRTLEAVLRRNPDHPGANHYYIHAIEASPYAERGLPCARRLQDLVPAAGHLVHMPAHIYMRIGDYAAAARANEQAVAADQAYIKKYDPRGVYPLMYYPHNIHFLAAAHCLQGRAADARKAADQLAAYVGPHVEAMPMLEGFLPMQPVVLVRFNRWDDVLAAKLPDEKRPLTRAVWHFARALACLAQGKADEAAREHREFLERKKALPKDAKVSDWNSAESVLGIAEAVLEAKMALARDDRPRAVELLRLGVQREDALNYGEPPDWMLPVRETLGAVLLLGGDVPEAEKVFRAGLVQHPRSGRCLLGLRESLKAQKKDYAARLVDQEFKAAWQNADGKEPDLKDF